MDDDQFEVYLDQILEAARGVDEASTRDAVAHLLGEFQEKCYLSGRHMLIDSLRRQLDGFDDREKPAALRR